MIHDNADALNRALDELAEGAAPTGTDVDPEILATVRWFHELGTEPLPDPRFRMRLEHRLLNQSTLVPPATDSPAMPTVPPARRTWRQRVPKVTLPGGLPPWEATTRGLVWMSWAIILGLIVFAVVGPLQLWPDRSTSHPPAVAPGIPLPAEVPGDLAAHPIVGTWMVETDS